MISQKESSINIDPQIYAKVQEIQQQYRVARENEWYAHQGQVGAELVDRGAINELFTRVRCLAREVGYLRTIIDTKGLLLDASIEEIYGDWV